MFNKWILNFKLKMKFVEACLLNLLVYQVHSFKVDYQKNELHNIQILDDPLFHLEEHMK